MDAPDLGQLSSSDLLTGVDERSAQEIRVLRDACRDHESGVSYRRRVVQGRLDIAKAERDRRSGTSQGALVDALPNILADQPTSRPRGDQRAVGIDVPGGGDDVDVPSITDLPELDDAALERRIAELQTTERELSATRRGLLDNLDRLQEELVVRYRDGRADIAEVVRGSDAANGGPADEPPDG